MARLVEKIFSRMVYFLLYFVTCGLLEALSNRSREESEGEKETSDDIKLDAIADPEEEQIYGAGCSQPRSKREAIYDVNVERRTRAARCGCWPSRRNKITPVFFVPMPGEVAADLYTVKTEHDRQQGGSLEDKSVEFSSENIVLGFSETQDSFTARKNSALALQSFATCARLNANFMSKTAWAPTENESGMGCSSDSQGEPALRPSFSSKVSFAWNALKRHISNARAGVMPEVYSEKEPGRSKGEASTVRSRLGNEPEVDSDHECTQRMSKLKNQGIEKIFRSGKSKKRTSQSPKSTSAKPGAIQELEETDSNKFDRDLYMRINKLTVTHDTCQPSSHDPFLVQDDVPALSEIPLAYLTINLGDESSADSRAMKSRFKSFFSRFKLKRN